MAIRVDPIPEYATLRPLLWANYERLQVARHRHLATMRDRHPEGMTEEVYRSEILAWGRIYNVAEALWDALERLWQGKESPLKEMIAR